MSLEPSGCVLRSKVREVGVLAESMANHQGLGLSHATRAEPQREQSSSHCLPSSLVPGMGVRCVYLAWL